MKRGLTTSARVIVKRLFRQAGYEVNSYDFVRNHLPHLYLAELFKRLNISCVFDVGANTGDFRNFLRDRVGYQGLIISFEPVAKHYEALKSKSHNDEDWKIYHMALGRENTSMEINVMKEGVFSSFMTPDHSIVSEFRNQNVVDHTELVDVRTLDSMINQFESTVSPEQTYLKLDTQGFDMEVVVGAEQTIERIPALQTEVSIRRIYKGMPSFFEAHQILAAKGFDIGELFLVSHDQLMRAIEFDCVMINSALSDK